MHRSRAMVPALGMLLAAGAMLAGVAQVGAIRPALAQGVAAAVPSAAPAGPAPEQVIAWRRANYKYLGEVAEAMKKGVESHADVKQYAAPAQWIADWAAKVPQAFPDGTQTGGGTHALPAIWTERATFNQRAAALQDAATKLKATAVSGDADAFAAQFKAMGGTCGACHRQFRARI